MVTYPPPDNKRHLVAAGGICCIDTATWIYDLDTDLDFWRPGPELQLQYGASVPYGNTFLAVGGQNNFDFRAKRDQIWEFNADPSDERWILRAEKLKSAKTHVSAFLVPDNYTLC